MDTHELNQKLEFEINTVVTAMRNNTGKFYNALAEVLDVADKGNRRRLYSVYKDEWEDFLTDVINNENYNMADEQYPF